MISQEHITKAKEYLTTSLSNSQNYDLVRDILSSQFPVDETLDKEGTTSLILATKRASIDFVRLCLASGADFKKVDSIGFTALHYACQGGYLDKVQLLFEQCDPLTISDLMNIKTKKYGETPLHMAVHSGSKSTVKYLLGFCSLEKYTEYNRQN